MPKKADKPAPNAYMGGREQIVPATQQESSAQTLASFLLDDKCLLFEPLRLWYFINEALSTRHIFLG